MEPRTTVNVFVEADTGLHVEKQDDCVVIRFGEPPMPSVTLFVRHEAEAEKIADAGLKAAALLEPKPWLSEPEQVPA